MSTHPAPFGFIDIEEWILHQVYEYPTDNHLTHTLFQQLEGVLKAEPSHRDTVNVLRAAVQKEPLSAEEQVAENRLELGTVQRAIESLIEVGLVKGLRNRNREGVYHTDLKLTPKGEAEAIRRKRKREQASETTTALAAARKRARDTGTENNGG